MTDDIISAYRAVIETSELLTESERAEYLAKTDHLTVNIGCPDEEYHSSSYISGSLLESAVSIKSASVRDALSKIDETPKPTDWYMLPQTVNALCRPQSNSITVPMTLFNAPYFVMLMRTIILISAAISCAVSFMSVIRTSRTPVRDIIFGGRDSVYRPNNAAAVTGLLLVVSALILYFLQPGSLACILGLSAFVIGICLVLPKLLSIISAVTAERTDGGRYPVLRLAVIQSGTKKTAVTGMVICTAVMLLTSSLYILSRSADKLYSVRNYSCDVIISELSERRSRYDTITADSKEFIYNTEETAQINGRSAAVNIFGLGDFEMFSGLRGSPESLAEDEIAFDKLLMKRLGISAGDTVTLTLKSDTLRPVTLTLTAVSGIDSIYCSTN